jgi:hypothetical protein
MTTAIRRSGKASRLHRGALRLRLALPWLGLAACVAFGAAGAARAATYKWVDEKGVIHYTDKAPPEQIEKATVLDKQARPVKQIDPPLSAEQRAAKEAEEARRAAVARAAEEAARKDRALLQSFTSEGEIELSKNRALATIDNQIQSTSAYIVQLNKRKVDADARRKALGDKPVPADLEREIANVDSELKKQEDLIASKKRESAQVTARYDADAVRWRELKAQSDAAALAAANATPARPPLTKK